MIVIQTARKRYRWVRRQGDVPSHSEPVVVGVQLPPQIRLSRLASRRCMSVVTACWRLITTGHCSLLSWVGRLLVRPFLAQSLLCHVRQVRNEATNCRQRKALVPRSLSVNAVNRQRVGHLGRGRRSPLSPKLAARRPCLEGLVIWLVSWWRIDCSGFHTAHVWRKLTVLSHVSEGGLPPINP